MNINTKLFQETVKKVYSGAGRIKSIPITNMLQLALKDNMLELTTRTVTSALTLKLPVTTEDEKEFTCTVWLDQFAKFIPKLPKKADQIRLDYLFEKAISIKTASGAYKFPIITDDNGIIVFKKMEPKETTETCVINTEDIQSIYQLHEPCVLKEFFGADMYKGYVINNEYVCTSNEEVIALSDNPFGIDNISLTQDTMKILAQVKEPQIKCSYSRTNYQLLFETDTMGYLCYEEVDKEQYPWDTFLSFSDNKGSNCFEFNKSDWLDALGRFVTTIPDLSDDTVYIDFDPGEGNVVVTNYNAIFAEEINSASFFGSRQISVKVKYQNLLVAINAMQTNEPFVIEYGFDKGKDTVLLLTSPVGKVVVSLEE